MDSGEAGTPDVVAPGQGDPEPLGSHHDSNNGPSSLVNSGPPAAPSPRASPRLPPRHPSNLSSGRGNSDSSWMQEDSSGLLRSASSGGESFLTATLDYSTAKSEESQTSPKQNELLSIPLVAGPLETEAEAAILQAIEQRQIETEFEEAAQMPLMPQLPPDTAHEFEEMSLPTPGLAQVGEEEGLGADAPQAERTGWTEGAPSSRPALDRTPTSTKVRESRVDKALPNVAILTDALQKFKAGKKHAAKRVLAKEKSTRHLGDDVGMSQAPRTNIDNFYHNAQMVFQSLPKKKDDDVGATDELEGTGELEADEELGGAGEGGKRPKRTERMKGKVGRAKRGARGYLGQIWDVLRQVFAPKMPEIYGYLNHAVLKIQLPLLGVAALFFYALENPKMKDTQGRATVSWWLIFVVRQMTTLALAKFTEYVIVDFLSLRSRVMLRLTGSFNTLTLVQARGWPCTLTLWGIYDFLMLAGETDFAEHWLFYQDAIDMFNKENDGGNIVDDDFYRRLLISAIVLGICTSLKRTMVAVNLGQRAIGELYGSHFIIGSCFLFVCSHLHFFRFWCLFGTV